MKCCRGGVRHVREGAIGGVINVIPKKPTEFFTHEAEVAIEPMAQALRRRFWGPLTDRLSYRFDASGMTSDGWPRPGKRLQLLGTLWRTSLSRHLRPRRHALSCARASITLRYWGTPLI